MNDAKRLRWSGPGSGGLERNRAGIPRLRSTAAERGIDRGSGVIDTSLRRISIVDVGSIQLSRNIRLRAGAEGANRGCICIDSPLPQQISGSAGRDASCRDGCRTGAGVAALPIQSVRSGNVIVFAG